MDWLDQTRTDQLEFYMIPPNNLDDSYGVLENVDLGASSLEAAYYTDSRTQGKIVIRDSTWIKGSLIRIVHSIPEWGWSNILGTYLVSASAPIRSNTGWSTTLTLQSILYGLGTDKAPSPWTLGSNSYRNAAIKQILDLCNRPYNDAGSVDLLMSSTSVMDSGESRLEHLFTLCGMDPKNRLDVDPKGLVVFPQYVDPDSRASKFELDLEDPRGIVYGDVETQADFLSVPNRVALVYRYSEKEGDETVQKEIGAYVDATGPTSPASRGFVVTKFEVLDEVEPATEDHIRELAAEKLADVKEKVEWKLKCCYLPIWEGDVIDLVVYGGDYSGRRKCLVKSVSIALDSMMMTLVLKETASGDTED